MAATTTRDLSQANYDEKDGFCHTAHWNILMTDGDYSHSLYGTVSLTRPETLIERSDLKKADIIADVQKIMGEKKIVSLENTLTTNINEQKTPTQGSFVPES